MIARDSMGKSNGANRIKMTRGKIALIVATTLALIWVIVNPPGRFGYCRFAWTTYSCVPHPFGDFQIRADGTTRNVEKTHDLRLEQIAWLLEPKPEILIIAIGWDGVVDPDERIKSLEGCEVKVLKTPDAIQLFNSLKGKKKVAIHLHSTC